jgi:hypothetical protein
MAGRPYATFRDFYPFYVTEHIVGSLARAR